MRERWPWVAPEVLQARWRAADGFLDTKELTFGLAEGSGAGLLLDHPVTGFEVRGGRLQGVRTAAGHDRDRRSGDRDRSHVAARSPRSPAWTCRS